MRAGTVALGLLTGGLGLLLVGGQALCQQPAVGPTAQQLDADIRLLEMLNPLQLTEDQINKLLPIARDMQTRREALERARSGPEITRALADLRQALLAGKSEDQLQPLRDQLDGLWQQMEPEERSFEQARQQALGLALTTLTPEQQRRLLAPLEEETRFALARAVGQSRQVPAEAWDTWLNEASRDLAGRASKGNREAAQAAAGQIRQLLEQTRPLMDADVAAQTEQLRAQIEDILRTAGAKPSAAWEQDMLRQVLGNLIFAERAQIVLEDKLKQIKAGG